MPHILYNSAQKPSVTTEAKIYFLNRTVLQKYHCIYSMLCYLDIANFLHGGVNTGLLHGGVKIGFTGHRVSAALSENTSDGEQRE